jgi:Flp pilus assembly pilin Flp
MVRSAGRLRKLLLVVFIAAGAIISMTVFGSEIKAVFAAIGSRIAGA